MDNNALLTEIISHNLVETLFQPIVDLKSGQVLGYEAFSRGPEGTDFYMPLPLISQAKSYNRMEELDNVLCNNALLNSKKRGNEGLLFMNLDTRTIYDNHPSEGILRLLKEYDIRSDSVAIEFSEKSVICKFDSFIDIVEEYRSNGFLICFDNVGSPYSNLFTVGKIRPDFMKIDWNLTKGISKDGEKRSKLDMELMIAGLVGARLIAEGVEDEEDLRTLIELGVNAAQGNLIGKPDRDLQEARLEAKEIISEVVQK